MVKSQACRGGDNSVTFDGILDMDSLKMNMAAGVSIFGISLIEIIGFCVILAGTKTIQGSAALPSYQLTSGSLTRDDVVVDGFVDHRRQRRQLVDTDATNASTVVPTSSVTKTTKLMTTPTMTPPTTPNGLATSTETVNQTIVEDTNHTYYRSLVLTPGFAGVAPGSLPPLWVDLADFGGSATKVTHESLSDSHRAAATIKLKFVFPFYGHEVKKVTIATGGFLYMSDFLHQRLTATQYVAPLMANFDTTLGNNSNIHYADNGTAFAVWWEDLHLQDNEQAGSFNFQTILFKDGRIVFNYKDLAVAVASIVDAKHPVEVGTSDAFYIDRTIPNSNVRGRTIYEYHRMEIDFSKVTNSSSIIIMPQPTCLSFHDCGACITARIGFSCNWCVALGRCSDGLDRKRQQWLQNGCHHQEQTAVGECPTSPPPRFVTNETGTVVTDGTAVTDGMDVAVTDETAVTNETDAAVTDETGTAVTNETDAAVTDGTGTAVTDKTGAAVMDETAVTDETYAAVTDETAVTDKTDAAVTDETGTAVTDETGAAVTDETAVTDKTGAAVTDGTVVTDGTGAAVTDETAVTHETYAAVTDETAVTDKTDAGVTDETGTAVTDAAVTDVVDETDAVVTDAMVTDETGAAVTDETGAAVTDETGAAVTDETGAAVTDETDAAVTDVTGTAVMGAAPAVGAQRRDTQPGIGVGGIIGIIVVLAIVVVVTSWFVFAYFNPQSRAGIWLIEHRPSTLRTKLVQVKFFKGRSADSADICQVSMGPGDESVV